MSSRQELIDNDPELNFRKRELFEERFATTKYRILNRIDQAIRKYEGQVGRLSGEDSNLQLVRNKIYYLQMFRDKVSATCLPEPLGNWWFYSFSLGAQGATLYLNHHEGGDIEGNEGNEYISLWMQDARFPLVSVRAKLLSAEEFASLYHVAGSTIRVWIRRGKIRSAVKNGNTWMIPELASPNTTRKYLEVVYQWNVPLEGNSLLSALNYDEPGNITIRQNYENKHFYTLIYSPEDESYQPRPTVIDESDVEKIEAYLIANPLVTYIGETEEFD